MTTELDKREIRGLTARNIAWFFGGIGGILITVMLSYFSILRKLDTIAILQNTQVLTQQRVDNNAADIKQLQQHVIPSLDIRMTRMEEQMKDKIFITNAP